MQTTLLVLQIPDSPSIELADQRIAGRGRLTTARAGELVVNRAKTLHHGLVSGPEPTDLRREIVSHRPRHRRVPQPPAGQEVAGAHRVHLQPTLAAGEQLSGGSDGADEITGTDTTVLGPTRGRGQPPVIRQGDVRPGEIHRRQREPSRAKPHEAGRHR